VDLATLLGMLGAMGCIVGAIFMGGSGSIFVNVPSLVIVVGGTFAVTLMRFPIASTLGAFKVAMRAFLHKSESPAGLIEEGVELANVARKEGLLGLESVEVTNPFLKKGIQLAIDGHDPEFVSRVLSKDINMTIERHEQGQSIFKAIADAAPAIDLGVRRVRILELRRARERRVHRVVVGLHVTDCVVKRGVENGAASQQLVRGDTDQEGALAYPGPCDECTDVARTEPAVQPLLE